MTDTPDASRRKFWSAVPDKTDHPFRVLMLEAMWWIGEPLSAIDLVDVLDGDVSMWEAAEHLRALERLGVVELVARSAGRELRDRRFDLPYRLKGRRSR